VNDKIVGASALNNAIDLSERSGEVVFGNLLTEIHCGKLNRESRCESQQDVWRRSDAALQLRGLTGKAFVRIAEVFDVVRRNDQGIVETCRPLGRGTKRHQPDQKKNGANLIFQLEPHSASFGDVDGIPKTFRQFRDQVNAVLGTRRQVRRSRGLEAS